MILALAIPTDGRKKCLEVLRDSFNRNTKHPQNIHLFFIDNKNIHAEEIHYLTYLDGWKCGSYELATNEKRKSISHNWNMGITCNSSYAWVGVLNDDVEFLPNWDVELERKITEDNGKKGLYLISKPNSFSGFVISQKLFDRVGAFRVEYPGGGYEDEDYFLSIGKEYGHRSVASLLSIGPIYSYPFSESRGLVKHRPLRDYAGKHWSKENKNKAVFEKFWKRMAEPSDRTYQGKSGGHYLYIGPDE